MESNVIQDWKRIQLTKAVHFPFYSRELIAKQKIVHSKKSYQFVLEYKLNSLAKIKNSCHNIYIYLFSNEDKQCREYVQFMRKCAYKIKQQNKEMRLKELFGKCDGEACNLQKQIMQVNIETVSPFDYAKSVFQSMRPLTNPVSEVEYGKLLSLNAKRILKEYNYIAQAERLQNLQQTLKQFNCSYICNDKQQLIEQQINNVDVDSFPSFQPMDEYTLQDILETQQDDLQQQSFQKMVTSLQTCLKSSLKLALRHNVNIYPLNIIYVELKMKSPQNSLLHGESGVFVLESGHVWIQHLNTNILSLQAKSIFRNINIKDKLYHFVDDMKFAHYSVLAAYLKSQSSFLVDLQSVNARHKQMFGTQIFEKKQFYLKLECLKASLILYQFRKQKQQIFSDIGNLKNKIKVLSQIIGVLNILPWLKQSENYLKTYDQLFKVYQRLIQTTKQQRQKQNNLPEIRLA